MSASFEALCAEIGVAASDPEAAEVDASREREEMLEAGLRASRWAVEREVAKSKREAAECYGRRCVAEREAVLHKLAALSGALQEQKDGVLLRLQRDFAESCAAVEEAHQQCVPRRLCPGPPPRRLSDARCFRRAFVSVLHSAPDVITAVESDCKSVARLAEQAPEDSAMVSRLDAHGSTRTRGHGLVSVRSRPCARSRGHADGGCRVSPAVRRAAAALRD